MLRSNAKLVGIPAHEAGRLAGTDGASLTSSAAPVSPAKALDPGGEGAALTLKALKRPFPVSSPSCSV